MPRKPGRPRIYKDPILDETPPRGLGNYKRKNTTRYITSITEITRNALPAEIILQFWMAILDGWVPRVEPWKGSYRVVPDPNALLPTPTLEQRTAAMRELSNRRDGQVPQRHELEATIRNQLEIGLPQELLQNANYALLDYIARGVNQFKDAIDAELVPPLQLQEPSQVATPSNDVLQEPSQVATPEESSSTELQELGQSNTVPGTSSED